MSRALCCDACGHQDCADLEATRVLAIRLIVGTEKSTPAQDVYEGDLCGGCQGRLLANYFGVGAADGLALPAFLNGGGG